MVEQLAEHEAQALLAPETVTGGGRTETQRVPGVITRIYEEADADLLRIVAAKVVAQPGVCILLATRAGGHVVFAQSPGGAADMGALLRESLAAVGGKGGGPRDFAQGSAPDVQHLEAVLSHAVTRLGF
jgi:alanyl-tRNA synthetase